MFETALVAFTTFFATIGPLDVAALFTVLTNKNSPEDRRSMALKGVLIATAILMTFVLLGDIILKSFGITLAAMQAAGGILLLLIAIEMVFAKPSGRTTTPDEQAEAEQKEDISVFPLATPLIAGPGTIGAVILLISNAQGSPIKISIVILALLLVLLLTWIMMLMASQLHKILGITGLHVISRVFGVLLAALAVQFIFDGIDASNLLR